MKRILVLLAAILALGFVPAGAQASGTGCGGIVTQGGGGTVITGTAGDDVIHSNQCRPRGAQTIYGLRGNDRIWGGKGSDAEYGGAGNDRLHSYHASMDPVLDGGGGFDKCVIALGAATDGVVDCEVILFKDAQGNGK